MYIQIQLDLDCASCCKKKEKLWQFLLLLQQLVQIYNKITVNTYIDFPLNRELDPSKVAIIREVYDTDNAHETFELELERALEAGCSIIVVEPSRLGDETARWIAVGNCLHKTAILSGIGAITTGRYYC